MTWKVGKKYRSHQKSFGNVFTCEAVLSNGDAAVTYTVKGVVYSTILAKEYLYEEVPDEDWRAIFKGVNGELKIGIIPYKSEQSVIDSWEEEASFIKAVKVSP